MKLSGRDRQIIDGFASRIKSLTEKLSQFATIKGDVLVQKDDGTYDLGTFQVQDKSGTVAWSSDADGQVTYKSPRHDQSYYGGFA